MALTTVDIAQIRAYIGAGPEDEQAERTLDRLEGYLAGMQFVAESRERESLARSERASKSVGPKTRRGRPPKVSNGREPLRVGAARPAFDEPEDGGHDD